jgi:hypothetical protein
MAARWIGGRAGELGHPELPAAEAPVVESAVDVGLSALRCSEAEGFAAVDGDERVFASPPGVGEPLDFRYRDVSVDEQLSKPVDQ